jgi:hypothetical protein
MDPEKPSTGIVYYRESSTKNNDQAIFKCSFASNMSAFTDNYDLTIYSYRLALSKGDIYGIL